MKQRKQTPLQKSSHISDGRLSPSRRMAVDTVREVRKRGAYAQNVAANTIHNRNEIQSDKAFAELLATGVVSTVGTLDEAIDRSLTSPDDIKPNVRDAMRVSAYEMLFLEKRPHVVVDQGVELVRYVERKAANLANAVLRKMVRDAHEFPWGDPGTDDAALARMFGFPEWLAKLLIGRYGRKGAASFMAACNEPAPVFLAVNSIKATPQEVLDELSRCGARPSFVGPEDRGCIVVGNSRATVSSKVLRDSKAIVSDASAQLAALVATPAKGKRFLEVGSGRGTKTVLLQSNAAKYNGEQARMCCVDMHAFKKGVLERRIADAGLQNISVFEGDATRLELIDGLMPEGVAGAVEAGGVGAAGDAAGELAKARDVGTAENEAGEVAEARAAGLFGKALIDAPCSGLGTLRRHPEIRWNVTPEKIEDLAAVGLGMLESAAPLIEPGGTIVFSTCTVTLEENERTIENFLASEAGAAFSIKPIGGRKFVMNALESGGPDVHFIAQLEKARIS